MQPLRSSWFARAVVILQCGIGKIVYSNLITAFPEKKRKKYYNVILHPCHASYGKAFALLLHR
jgi:hypothetical protein